MADLIETPQWEDGIRQLELTDPMLGGPNGLDNVAPRQLANRTAWLKQQLSALALQIAALDIEVENFPAMATAPLPNTLSLRDSEGRMQTADPVEAMDIVNLRTLHDMPWGPNSGAAINYPHAPQIAITAPENGYVWASRWGTSPSHYIKIAQGSDYASAVLSMTYAIGGSASQTIFLFVLVPIRKGQTLYFSSNVASDINTGTSFVPFME